MRVMKKPRIAITMGDPTGVGPEVIVGAWHHAELHDLAAPVVFGDPVILQRAADLLQSPIKVKQVDTLDAVPAPTDVLPCLPVVDPSCRAAPVRQIDARGGQAAYDALRAAARAALADQVDAIVTAPLHKAALWAAGHHYPGHTELLAEICGVDDFAMMLYLAHGGPVRGPAGLGVIHVTLHMALADVFNHLSTAEVLRTIRLTSRTFSAIKGSPPRVAVAALNPHAGEEGLFGTEEQSLIAPAVQAARESGITVEGPLPADTAMVRAAAGEFDAVVAMYHDQGHIALKLLGMHRAVNVTLGLPIVRTSVAHGTAFDLAWQGRAETSSMIEAVRVASLLARDKLSAAD